ncbi:MAG: alpha-amylase family glycosyl hydrolase [Trueperaceae bacterium]
MVERFDRTTTLFYRITTLERPKREFHISRAARQRYEVQESLFSTHGTVIFANPSEATKLAYKMNQARNATRYPEKAVKAGDLYAAGLLDEILHLVVDVYLENVNKKALQQALGFVQEKVALEPFLVSQHRFVQEFPATEIFQNKIGVEEYLARSSGGVSHREIVLEETLMLYLANENPALKKFQELFDDTVLQTQTAYTGVIKNVATFFAKQPPLAPGLGSLFEMLRAPALASPDSLEGQLEYIRDKWATILGERFTQLVQRVLQSIDILKEERKMPFGGNPGNFPAAVMTKEALEGSMFVRERGVATGRQRAEYERFSPDSSWMPRVVMLAKSSYVWLDQLAKQYGQDIHRLDHVPDAELDELARRGFNGLWLIGLWERSVASKIIKHRRGQPDAVASAYSLYDYQIAHDLGGDAAYENLRDRAAQRGIRLASDMVPNHVGIDGRWVVEHPDWFIQLDHPPYPSYTFNSDDVSTDDRVGIYLEDHYYDNSDAAVVFKRVDKQTGHARYIYHGNDGTSFPWNDTAQINYLSAEAREAVIQTIFHVARKFSIIRFDAAMTLAKQHIQRLWFPEPGTGGDIPSRAQYGSLTNEEFDRLIPQEFWREVVDRVAQEVPDTLLLAEAFWMMEGYFVRTLGMHRVYNSAFMNMLKREDNANYRLSIKNVLEFDPDILKRYVNFMNNPDEETAVHQFGKDDKYFGVCILMSTLPGLPMYGHGQVEGYTEKYGMEYRRAKYDEQPDQWLIDRHYREVFPLLHRRAEFAEVENFLLYDFYTEHGHVNEDVYAYSNVHNDKGSLVVFNNKFATAKGWIKRSTSYKDKGSGQVRQRDVHEGLRLHGGDKHFVILRDHIAGLEYMRQSRDVQRRGLYFELEAFKYRVFTDIHEVHDVDGSYGAIYDQIGWQGVPNLFNAKEDLRLMPLHGALKLFLDLSKETSDKDIEKAYRDVLVQAKNFGLELTAKEEAKVVSSVVNRVRSLDDYPFAVTEGLKAYVSDAEHTRRSLLMYAALSPLDTKWVDAWRLFRLVDGNLLTLMLEYRKLFRPKVSVSSILSKLVADDKVKHYLRVNTWQEKTYFNQELYHTLLGGFVAGAWLETKQNMNSLLKEFATAEAKSEYQFDKLAKPAKSTVKKVATKKVTAKKKVVKKEAAKKPIAKKAVTEKVGAERATLKKAVPKKKVVKQEMAEKKVAKKETVKEKATKLKIVEKESAKKEVSKKQTAKNATVPKVKKEKPTKGQSATRTEKPVKAKKAQVKKGKSK